MAPIGVICSSLNLFVLLLNKRWKNTVKLHYIISAIFNLCLGIFYDNMEIFPSGFYNATGIFILLECYNAIICYIRNYLQLAFESMWMWNITCFAIQRFLIVYFPLRSDLISKIFTWKLILLEVLIALLVWSYIIFTYIYICFGSTPISCYCYSNTAIYPWVSIPYNVLNRYLTYVVPLICMIIAQILLLIKIASSFKQRKSLIHNQNVSKNGTSNNRLNVIVILTISVYIIIIFPPIFLAMVSGLTNNLDSSLYLLKNMLILYSSTVGIRGFILVRAADIIILFIMVKDYRKMLYVNLSEIFRNEEYE